jgi:hypothetical protein
VTDTIAATTITIITATRITTATAALSSDEVDLHTTGAIGHLCFFLCFLYLIAAFSCVALPGPLPLVILRGEGRIAEFDMDRTWERKEELLTGCISFTIKYPRSAHKLLTTYLSFVTDI